VVINRHMKKAVSGATPRRIRPPRTSFPGEPGIKSPGLLAPRRIRWPGISPPGIGWGWADPRGLGRTALAIDGGRIPSRCVKLQDLHCSLRGGVPEGELLPPIWPLGVGFWADSPVDSPVG
jgi:hypothetical protein